MLFCYPPKIPQVMNQALFEYCTRSTQESVRKITEKYNLERNKPKFNNPLEDNGNDKPQPNFYGFLILLSVSTIGFILYKRIR